MNNSGKMVRAKGLNRDPCKCCSLSHFECGCELPHCKRCLQNNKKCEYPVNLKWGGRPYKKPKLEKMNKVANISAKQLARQWKAAPFNPKKRLRFKDGFKPYAHLITESNIVQAHAPTKVSAESERAEPETSSLSCQRRPISDILTDISTLLSIQSHNEEGLVATGQTRSCESVRPYADWLLSLTTSGEIDISQPIRNNEGGCIPRQLTPLPDMLLNIPIYYNAFKTFCSSTSLCFTVAESTIYELNPLQLLLPSVAIDNEGVLCLVVAFGLAHQARLMRKKLAPGVIGSLLKKASDSLLLQLQQNGYALNETFLALIVLLCSYSMFVLHPDDTPFSIRQAKRILLKAGYNRPFENLRSLSQSSEVEFSKTKLSYCIFKWFGYTDVFTSLLSSLEPSEELVNICNGNPQKSWSLEEDGVMIHLDSPVSTVLSSSEDIDYCFADSTYENLGKGESEEDVDFMLGFSTRFLSLFDQLRNLIRLGNLEKRIDEQVYGLSLYSNEYRPSPQIVERALELELLFRKFGGTIPSGDNEKDNTDLLQASNHCFSLMGLILLHRRVLRIPRSSRIVQEMSRTVIDLMNKFVDGSRFSGALGLTLPLFVAGCECKDPSVRELYRLRIQSLALDRYPVWSIMNSCWSTSAEWYEAFPDSAVNAVLG